VPFAKVDAQQARDLAAKYVPQLKFPQLLWFMHGQATRYHYSMRKTKDIVDFVMALDRDPVETVSSEKDVHQYDRAVFAQLPKSSSSFKALEVVAAQHMDTVAFLHKEASEVNITFMSERDGERPSGTFQGDLSATNLEQWLRQMLTKSEPAPKSPDMYGGSWIVVGSTLEEMVMQPSVPAAERKDVFFLAYASWCGFSRKFMPIWEEFAIRAAAVPNLLVMKMDGSLNGSPLRDQGFRWDSYPTILFLKAGETEPVAFHGERTVEHLAEFANEHGSRRFDLNGALDQDRLDRALRMEDESEL
jgi:thiol-disulfide isomerase/thioredoxin